MPQILWKDPEAKLTGGLIRIRSGHLRETLASMKSVWGEVGEGLPYRIGFWDQQVADQYRRDERRAKIVGGATTFAILIACMGLFGHASLAVSRRTKEIGVRKSVGATLSDILRFLSRDLALLLLFGNAIAWPWRIL